MTNKQSQQWKGVVRDYCTRMNLMDEDYTFIQSQIQQAEERVREECKKKLFERAEWLYAESNEQTDDLKRAKLWNASKSFYEAVELLSEIAQQ